MAPASIREVRDEAAACAAPAAAGRIPEITPSELALRTARGDRLTLVDVRERQEWDIGRIPGARLAPLSRLADEMGGLDPASEIVLYCKGGTRSQAAGQQLRAAGFTRVLSLAGGILRYAADVDPSLPRY